MRDAVVVGAGPNGLAVLKALAEAGVDAMAVDKGAVCHHLEEFPENLVFFSTAERLTLDAAPMGDGPGTNPTLAQALDHYRGFVDRHALEVAADRELVALDGEDGGFSLTFADGGSIEARKVVLATGIYSQPRLLGVPGEEGPGVSHWYRGPHDAGDGPVLVVGGGNSAAEVVLDLLRSHRVTLVHRGSGLDPGKVKPWVLPEVEGAIEAGSVAALFASTVSSLEGGVATVTGPGGEERIPFGRAYLMTGYRPDRPLLEGVGLSLEGEREVPRHDPASLESSVPGVYVAGALLAGADAHRVFIENGRLHGAPIATHLSASLRPAGGGDRAARHSHSS